MKRVISVLSGAVFLSALLVAGASAQETAARIVHGGILNGRAVSLPKPEYPEATRAAGIGGAIAVNVEIDESGNVVSAEADPYDQRQRRDPTGNKIEPVQADASLLAAAVNAALRAKFSPTQLSGQPVRVKGKILYNFVAETSDAPTWIDGKSVNGGVLNSVAISLASPEYPEAAKAVRAEGLVTVDIIIDEDGDVTAATAVSGHPLLRAAAEKAAKEAKFTPTRLNGDAVKVRGTLTYKFVLPRTEDL